MKDTYGHPPAIKQFFGSKEEEIEYLYDQVVYWFWKPKTSRARYYAERLAKLIGDPNQESAHRHSEEWVAIWEARGNTEEAIRSADVTISRERSRWASYDAADRASDWFREDVRFMQNALFLQADRHLRMGQHEKAKQRMIEAAELSRQYGVALDDQEQALLQQLAPEAQE